MESERFICQLCAGHVRDTITGDSTIQFALVLFSKHQSEEMGQILQKIIINKPLHGILGIVRRRSDDDYPLRVRGRKAQKASGDVCLLFDITVTPKIKILYIIGLDFQSKRQRERERLAKTDSRGKTHTHLDRGR